MDKRRIAVAISGGVDSSTAALLLKKAGHEVIGLHMRLWHDEQSLISNHNKLRKAAYRAEQVCHAIGIPFHVVELENEFRYRVVDYFCQGYVQGQTPNPCIVCNKHMKFGLLMEKALFLGADYLATGHYARITCNDGAWHLLKGRDSNKDQSYMLYTLEQDNLSRILFPLGDYLKVEVRKIADQNGLPTAEEPGSQDICFIDGKYSDFFRRTIAAKAAGEIVNSQGAMVGQHNGIAFYTIGQRRGLGFAAGQRYYVTKIEPENNRVIVGTEEELYSRELIAKRINWLSSRPPSGPIDITVKIRYKSPEVAATLYPKSDSIKVEFHQPQRAVAPGQAVVFYQNDEVIGGGTIEQAA